MKINFQEIPVAAWSLLLSHRQDFLIKHLARVPITPNQEGTMERRDGVFLVVGTQDLDKKGYQVSALGDVEFYWKNDRLDVDAVFRTGIVTPFPPSTLDVFEMSWLVENLILIDEEQDKENSLPPHPTTPNSERPTQPPVLMTSRAFGTRIEYVHDYAYWNLFE